MILFDPRHLKSFPNHNAEATVVYASSEENIDTTIVNGKIVYHRGTFSGGCREEDLIREIGAEVPGEDYAALHRSSQDMLFAFPN